MLVGWFGLFGCSPGAPTLAPADAEVIARLERACGCEIALTQAVAVVDGGHAQVTEGRVVVLRLRSARLPSSALDDLAPLTGLYHLDLSGSTVDSLAGLPALPGLRDVDVSQTTIASLSGLERSPVTWLDISGTRLTTLDGVPSTVKALIARDLGIALPDGHGFDYFDLGPGLKGEAPAKPKDPVAVASTVPARGNPPLNSGDPVLDVVFSTAGARRGAGTRSHNGFTGVNSGSISTGRGLIEIELDGLRRSAGSVDLALRSGTALVWLKDDQGQWVAYALSPGELHLFGQFGTQGHEHYFFVQSAQGFEGLTWTVK